MPSLAVLFDPSRIAIQPHPCLKCSGPMVLLYIKPSRIGFERRMFQGVNYDHVDKIVTETHSMNGCVQGYERLPSIDPKKPTQLMASCQKKTAPAWGQAGAVYLERLWADEPRD